MSIKLAVSSVLFFDDLGDYTIKLIRSRDDRLKIRVNDSCGKKVAVRSIDGLNLAHIEKMNNKSIKDDLKNYSVMISEHTACCSSIALNILFQPQKRVFVDLNRTSSTEVLSENLSTEKKSPSHLEAPIMVESKEKIMDGDPPPTLILPGSALKGEQKEGEESCDLNTALSKAVRHKKMDDILMLVQRNGDPLAYIDGTTAVKMAAEMGDSVLVDFFIDEIGRHRYPDIF